MTYPLKVRKEVLAFIDDDGSIAEAEREFGIYASTIREWMQGDITISNKITEEEHQWRKQIGETFREAREEKQLRQNYVAQMMNIHPSVLSKFERGDAAIPLYAFRKGCQVLGKDANYMLGRRRKRSED